jgi:hypothetical protein
MKLEEWQEQIYDAITNGGDVDRFVMLLDIGLQSGYITNEQYEGGIELMLGNISPIKGGLELN